jgi:hypothetical protein
MKKSTQVTLTVAAAMGLAARGQQAPQDPCGATSFNSKACQAAVKRSRFCWQGQWIPMTDPQPYPYYYGLYQDYVANGGSVAPVPAQHCGGFFLGAIHGGFGGIGAGHQRHAGG